jgi:putative heme degradation protein
MTERTARAPETDADLGFSFTERKSGEIVIARVGRQVTVLRGAATDRFRRLVSRLGEQQAMARTTGNHRRGNERGS